MPVFSIILPCYNSERTLARAVESVQAQSVADFEILIVEDGSTDGTVALAKRLAGVDPRIRVFSDSARRGVSAARNVGLDESQGDWITLIDADDLWMPDRLEKLLAQADGADFIADNIMTYDTVAGCETGPLYPPFETQLITLLQVLECAINGITYDFGLAKPIMSRSFLEQHRLRYVPSIVASEDRLFYLDALAFGVRFRIADFIGYVYSTPIGFKSAKRSPHTHTVGNARVFAGALDDLRARHGSRLTALEQSRFDRAISQQHAWSRFSEGVKTRAVAPAIAAFVSSGFVRAQVWRRASRALMATWRR